MSRRPLLAAALAPAVVLALLAAAASLPGAGAAAQTVERLRESDEPLEINADEGIEWNRDAKTYPARGNARAASGEVEVLADVLSPYYRAPAGGREGGSQVYLRGGEMGKEMGG